MLKSGIGNQPWPTCLTLCAQSGFPSRSSSAGPRPPRPSHPPLRAARPHRATRPAAAAPMAPLRRGRQSRPALRTGPRRRPRGSLRPSPRTSPARPSSSASPRPRSAVQNTPCVRPSFAPYPNPNRYRFRHRYRKSNPASSRGAILRIAGKPEACATRPLPLSHPESSPPAPHSTAPRQT